jgi:hypothetical protein
VWGTRSCGPGAPVEAAREREAEREDRNTCLEDEALGAAVRCGELDLAVQAPRSKQRERERQRERTVIRAWKMRRLERRSGVGNSILRSRRPGRSSAGSNVSARFVAMITCTEAERVRPRSPMSKLRMRIVTGNVP